MNRKTPRTGLGGASRRAVPTAVVARASENIQGAASAAAVVETVVGAAVEICSASSAVWWKNTDGRPAASAPRELKPVSDGPALRLPSGLRSWGARPGPVLELSPRHSKYATFLAQLGARRAVLIPARDGRRRLGTLTVQDGRFHQVRIDLLVAVVRQAAVALRCLAVVEGARRQSRERPRLDRFCAVLNSALSLDELLEASCRFAAEASGAGACLLFLAEGEAQLRLRAQVGPAAELAAIAEKGSQLAELIRAQAKGEALWQRGRGVGGRALQGGPFHSALGLALSVRGQPMGALLLLGREGQSFPADQRRALLSFASQAAVAIENLQLLENTQHRLLEMADLTWVSTRVAATHDVARIAETVTQAASNALDVPRVGLLLADAEGRLSPVAGGELGVAVGNEEALEVDGHVGSEVLRSGSPQAIVDAAKEGRGGDALMQWLGARSLLCVPMVGQQGLHGVLAVGDERPRAFSSRAVAMLSNYANQAALALQSALLYQDVVRHLNELSRLFDVSRSLASSLDLGETLDSMLTSTAELLEAPFCSVMLVERETGDLVIKAARGFWPDDALSERLKPGEGLAGRAVQSGMALSSSDISRDGRFRYRERARELGLHAGIVAPLIARGRTVGVINLYRTTTREFTENDKRLLTSLANSAAVAIENAHLYQEAQERAQFLSALMSEINHRIRNTLQAIAGLLSMELARPQVSAKAAIARGIARIQSIAVVHELMRTRELQFVDMKQAARSIFQVTAQSLFNGPVPECAVTGTRVMLPSQKATSVALVLAELIENALRHGLAGKTEGRLSISLTEGGGDVTIQVRDNGVGLPEGFDLATNAGLGLKIVGGLVEQELGGKLDLEARGGLLVRARFPKL